MSLAELKVIDKIEVVENGTVQVREATRILRDGQEIAKTYRRWSFAPGSDITGQPDKVVAICNTAWTKDVVDAYKAQQAAQEAERLARMPAPEQPKEEAASE